MNKVEIIVKALDDKLATDIVAIDMMMASPLFDSFIIASASNEKLAQALRDNVEDCMEENGFFVKKIEGIRGSKWILMDYGDVIVHIFDKEERQAYGLEKLWADMPRIDIEGFID